MKFVVLACAVALAVGQTNAGSNAQDTHIKHNGAPDSTDARDAVSRSWSMPSSNSDPVSDSPGATRGNSTLATTGAPSFDDETHTVSNNSKVEANMEERTAFENRKHEHVGNFSGYYDASGRLNPLAWNNNVTYNPADAKETCEASCTSYAVGNAQTDAACKFGCSSWLAYSSLNWEPVSLGWRGKLLKRCKKNCMQPRKWHFLHQDKAKHSSDHSQSSLSQSYWYGRAKQMIPTYEASEATNFNKVPYNKYAKLPFRTAGHCTEHTYCQNHGGHGCGPDLAEVENMPVGTPRSCVNQAENICFEGCDFFKAAQDNQM